MYSGRGKAKKAASRTAEREQRRMHGEQPLQATVEPPLTGPVLVLFQPEDFGCVHLAEGRLGSLGHKR